ncbi:MAG: UPF0175 family protein [Clostridia bacterium]|nr:UPF0175 family protein [Clostridia bacterium]
MSVTKSVRLDEGELREIRTVVSLMPGATEAGVLKHLLLLGLEAKKRDLAVMLYTRYGFSTGEIAEKLSMSRLDVLHALEEGRVRVLDIDPGDFADDLERKDLRATG